jgi:glutamate carboxypeptidase
MVAAMLLARPCLLVCVALLACTPRSAATTASSDGTSGPAAPAVAPSAARGGLSETERAIVAAVDRGNDAALALLERTVNVNSGTHNLAGVRTVGDLFRAELDALGFDTRWIEGAPFGRAGHLVAERAGAGGGPKVLLVGHLDTVFEPSSPFQRLERLAGGRARGPGVIDMKGGDVIIVAALRALAEVGALDALHVVVVMTGDEESAGTPLAAARAALIEAARGASYALGFEDGDGDPRTAVISRRGHLRWVLRVTGTPAHSSQIFRPEIGHGAIFEAARFLDGFRRELAGQPHLTFNPGLVLGGTQLDAELPAARGSAFGKANVVAEHAVVQGDLRALSDEQLTAVRATMERLAAASLPGTRATLEFAPDAYPPMAPSDGNRRLLALYDGVSRDLGTGPVTAVDPDRAGAADISFVAPHVPMALDGLGLMGTGGHTVDETADLATLPSQTRRAAVLLHRLAEPAAD